MAHVVELFETPEEHTEKVIWIEKARAGLMPIRRKVTRMDGKTYEQTFWVKPKDLRRMNAENAVNFLDGMMKAQKHFEGALDKVKEHLPEAASAIESKMKETGQKLLKVGELQIQLAEHSRQNPVSGDALLAAVHSRSEAEIPSHIKEAISKLYKQVTTTTFGEGLKVGKEGERASTLQTSTAVKPHTWDTKSWATKMKDVVGKKMDDIRGIFGFRKKMNIADETIVVAKEKKPAKKTKEQMKETNKEINAKLDLKLGKRKIGGA